MHHKRCITIRFHYMLQNRCIPTALLIILLAASASCQALNKRVPLSSDLVIASPDVYESLSDKNLVVTYQKNLQNIYSAIRSLYKPSQLEFFMISGICFRALQIKSTYETYLFINTKISQHFNDNKTTFEQRARAIFANYTKHLLTLAAQEKELLQDSALAGIIINTRWKTERTSQKEYHTVFFEEITLAVQKEQVDNYLSATITDQELLDQSTIIALREGDNPQIITLPLD
jgi:hypothetical protein